MRNYFQSNPALIQCQFINYINCNVWDTFHSLLTVKHTFILIPLQDTFIEILKRGGSQCSSFRPFEAFQDYTFTLYLTSPSKFSHIWTKHNELQAPIFL